MFPHATSASSATFFYDAAFAHTMTSGLVPAILGQVTVLSLIKVTGILRGPQYPITSTSSWLHSPLHAAAVQSRRITRIAFSAAPGGPAGLPRPEDPLGQEVPQDQEAPQDRVRLFDRPARPRQVPLCAPHSLIRKRIA